MIKKSACNVGDLGSILGWEEALEKGTVTNSNILAWRIRRTEQPGRGPWGCKESDMTEQLSYFR